MARKLSQDVVMTSEPTAEAVCASREDGTHCEHWWDNSGPCCACGDDTHDGTEEDHGEREEPEADAPSQSTEAPRLVTAGGSESEERARFDAWMVYEREEHGVVRANLDELAEVWWASSQEPRPSVAARPEPPVEGPTLADAVRGDVPCFDCGTGYNIVWFTNSEFWNAIMDPTDERGRILCPLCFVIRTYAVGHRSSWELTPVE